MNNIANYNNQINNSHQNSSKIFYFCYSILLISFYLSEAFNKLIFNIVDIGVYSLLLIRIVFFQKYTLKQLINIYTIGSIILISFICSKNTLLLRSFILIIATQGINFSYLLKRDLYIRFFSTLFIVVLAALGKIENFINYREGEIRYSMGFSHPNLLAINIMIIYILFLYYNKNKYKILNIILLLFVISIIVIFTSNRTCVLIILLGYIFMKFKYIIKNKYIQKIIICLPIICVGISMLFAITDYSKSNLLIKLNGLLNTRIENCSKFIKEYGFSLFGQKIEIIGTRISSQLGVRPKILDNAYVYIGIAFGLSSLIIIISFYIIIIKKLIKEQEYELIAIIIVFLILGIMETYFFYPFLNITLIFFGKVFYKYT